MKVKEVFTAISPKYANFTDIFCPDLMAKLLEHTRINDYVIELIDGKRPLYYSISSLKLVELEILKIYIKTNQPNNFIRSSNFLTGTLIFLVQKLDVSFCLCVKYQSLKNLTIRSWYSLVLINESLNWLDQAKCLSQLNLISVYHWMKICKGDK